MTALSSPAPMTLPTAPSDNRFRLLLVEDNQVMANQILALLNKTGFECFLALDSQAGMEAFNQNTPHLVLLNFVSEQTDGEAFCRWVRDQSPVPLVTLGPVDENLEVKAFKIGADDYLQAPLRPAVLLARVVAQLRRSYRYNTPQAKQENPFGLPVENEPATPRLPSGWAECEACGYRAPSPKFEKEDYLGNIKMACPQCRATEHIVISLD